MVWELTWVGFLRSLEKTVVLVQALRAGILHLWTNREISEWRSDSSSSSRSRSSSDAASFASTVRLGPVQEDDARDTSSCGAGMSSGDSVFIKTNAAHGGVEGRPGIVTSNEVLSAVVRVVKDLGAGHVVVGDRPARRHDSEDVLIRTGQRDAALAAGADEVYAPPKPIDDPSAWVLVQPPGYEETWSRQGGILAMRRIVEADHFING